MVLPKRNAVTTGILAHASARFFHNAGVSWLATLQVVELFQELRAGIETAAAALEHLTGKRFSKSRFGPRRLQNTSV